MNCFENPVSDSRQDTNIEKQDITNYQHTGNMLKMKTLPISDFYPISDKGTPNPIKNIKEHLHIIIPCHF